jgi:hypothetical protein
MQYDEFVVPCCLTYPLQQRKLNAGSGRPVSVSKLLLKCVHLPSFSDFQNYPALYALKEL